MSYLNRPFQAVEDMVKHFGFMDRPVTKEVFDYRMGLLEEEYGETRVAADYGDPEGIVDGHIDLIIIAVGNLAMFGVDIDQAFDEVMTANLEKRRGKRSESDPEGASIYKPEGWVPPSHIGNHGILDEMFGDNSGKV